LNSIQQRCVLMGVSYNPTHSYEEAIVSRSAGFLSWLVFAGG
jgi:hypothetical protein